MRANIGTDRTMLESLKNELGADSCLSMIIPTNHPKAIGIARIGISRSMHSTLISLFGNRNDFFGCLASLAEASDEDHEAREGPRSAHQNHNPTKPRRDGRSDPSLACAQGDQSHEECTYETD